VSIVINQQLQDNLSRWAELRALSGWPVDLAKLSQALDGIVEFYHPTKFYLFGSLVNGDFNADSDLDLLIVVPDDADREHRSGQQAYLIKTGTRVPMDILMASASRFEQQRQWINYLANEVATTGVLLHAE